MVLRLCSCSCFGAALAVEKGNKPAPAQQLAGGEEQKEEEATGDQGAAAGEAAVGEPKTTMAVDRSMVVKEKRAQAAVVMHQLPFHSRPGLL